MGDAFNMRHPLTGGGMTVALSDIVVLRDLLKPLRDLNDAPTLCKYLEAFYTLRKVSTQFICFFVSFFLDKYTANPHFYLLVQPFSLKIYLLEKGFFKFAFGDLVTPHTFI